MNRRSFLAGLVLGPIAIKLSGKTAFGKSEPIVYTQNISPAVSNEVRRCFYTNGSLYSRMARGDLWFDTSTQEFKVFDGSNWTGLGSIEDHN